MEGEATATAVVPAAATPTTSTALVKVGDGRDGSVNTITDIIVAAFAANNAIATLRRQRTPFEMIADGPFYEKALYVATYLAGLVQYRLGRDRLLVFLDRRVCQTIDKALGELSPNQDDPFNVDEWYVKILSKNSDALERDDPNVDIAAFLSRLRTTFISDRDKKGSIDWLDEVLKVEMDMPGFVHAMHSAVMAQHAAATFVEQNVEAAMAYLSSVNPDDAGPKCYAPYQKARVQATIGSGSAGAAAAQPPRFGQGRRMARF